jgi:hypothetical protein
MMNLFDEIHQEQRRIDMREQADRQRVIRQVTRNTNSLPKSGLLLLAIGRWLVDLGCWLQTRYGNILQESEMETKVVSLAVETSQTVPGCSG